MVAAQEPQIETKLDQLDASLNMKRKERLRLDSSTEQVLQVAKNDPDIFSDVMTKKFGENLFSKGFEMIKSNRELAL